MKVWLSLLPALLLLSSCAREISPVGKWQVDAAQGFNASVDPAKTIEFKPDGTFQGWYLETNGYQEGSGKWAHAWSGSQPGLHLVFSLKDPTATEPEMTTLYSGAAIVDERAHGKVIYRRVP